MKSTFFHLMPLLVSMTLSVQTHAMHNLAEGLRASWDKNNNNYRVGHIDRLMLARTVSQDGYNDTEQKINEHLFVLEVMGEARPSSRYVVNTVLNAYRIHHHCVKNDGSELSNEVFHTIYKIEEQKLRPIIKNPDNQYSNAIDECTTYMHLKNADEVECVARFYDKNALLAALQTLRK